MKVLHVFAAFWLVCGVVGRGVTFSQAGRAADVHSAYALLQASELFERRMVIPGSMTVLIFGLLAAWQQGWPILGLFQGAATNWLVVSLLLYLALLIPLPLFLIPRRKVRAAAAKDALAAGAITPALTAALHDRGVFLFRTGELVIMAVIIYLMVAKPF
jgi:hypothetical protein